tara:strand:+ start:279 stop:1664 length:1386 start_codon:yes stop_codon:yes gene_type:complete
MPKLYILLASTALLTTSCASAPPFASTDAGVTPAPVWTSAPDLSADQLDDWVASFNDPALARLVSQADSANYNLAAAVARYDAALASARSANSGRMPSIGASGGATQREANAGSSTTYTLGASVSWEADIWGRLGDRAQAGLADARASEADLQAARLSVAASVAKGWFFLIEARLQSELAAFDVETKEQSLSLVDRRFQRGVSRSSDVRTARSALASSQAALASRLRTEAAAARSLEILLGEYPDGELPHDVDLPELGPLAGVGAPGDLLARRPDVVAAEARLASAGYRASEARKALLPRLSLTGSADTSGLDLGDLIDSDALIGSLIGNLTAPIFSGGALRAERDRTLASARAQLAVYANTVLTAWREAEDAIHADRILAERVEALTAAAEEAAAAEELVLRQYTSGVATIFELLDAQSRRISSESFLISARRERATNRVDLYLAIAGNYRTTPTVATEG